MKRCYYRLFLPFLLLQGQLHIGEIGNRHIALDLQGSKPTITITKYDKGKTIVDEIRYQKLDIPQKEHD